MIAIMTVTGLDHTGIIAAVSGELARRNVNILNVSQTIMDRFFTMILHVDVPEAELSVQELREFMEPVAEQEGLSIRVQSEEIFTAMHRV